jgi:hypothetical protein
MNSVLYDLFKIRYALRQFPSLGALTVWFNGSGDADKTTHIIAPFLAKHTCAQVAEPLFAWSHCYPPSESSIRL